MREFFFCDSSAEPQTISEQKEFNEMRAAGSFGACSPLRGPRFCRDQNYEARSLNMLKLLSKFFSSFF